MRVHNAFADDSGQQWEFDYEEETVYKLDPITGEPVTDENGELIRHTEVRNFRYRKEPPAREGIPNEPTFPSATMAHFARPEEEWLELPPWADVREEWKITLCFFDEDEETEELTYWPVVS